MTDEIRKEANVAAKWWADTLRGDPTIDIGDAKLEGVMNWARDNTPDVDPETIDAFESVLAEEIEEMAVDAGWNPAKPDQGKIYRSIRVDYHPDEILTHAGEAVGIDVGMTTFPSKTDMWIDPGKVTVRAGYSADIETIWSEEDDNE